MGLKFSLKLVYDIKIDVANRILKVSASFNVRMIPMFKFSYINVIDNNETIEQKIAVVSFSDN